MNRVTLSIVCLLAPAAAAAQAPVSSPHDSLQGPVRTVDAPTGVGMSLWVVRLRVPTELRIRASGAGLPLTALQPGDIVRVSYGSRPAGYVAYTIERVGHLGTGPVRSP